MKAIFKNRLYVLLAFVLISLQVRGQETARFIDVKGIVVNEMNVPVVASIIVKGTRIGGASNEAGYFELKQVSVDGTLIISGIGLKMIEVAVQGKADMGRIKIYSNITSTEEVIVRANTGYETLQPNEVNGSVVVVDHQQLNLQTGTNILKRLDGAVSGLLFNIGKTNDNPQNKTGISIRGLGTVNGPLDPLIVLDGFIYEGNIENINPNEIENITVLKDAAAASVWGARAGNGVIVISSKKGALNQKMQVSASMGMIITERPDLSTIPQLNPADHADVETFLFNQGYFDGRINVSPWLALSPVVKLLLNRRKGLISAADSALQIAALQATDSRDQYEQLVYAPSFTQQHSIGLNGGSTQHAYRFFAGYDKSIGNLKEAYKKINLRMGNSFQLHKRIRLNLETNYSNSEAISGQTAYGSLRPADGMMVNYDIREMAGGIDLKYNTAYTDTLLGGRLLDLRYYPLEDYKHNRTNSKLQEIYAQAGLNIALTNFLNADIKYQYQGQHTISEKLADRYSYEARELINSFTQYNSNNGLLSYPVPVAGIRRLSNSRVGSETLRGQVNFDKRFGRSRANAIMGIEQRAQVMNGDSYTSYGYNADPLTTAAVDVTNLYTDPITGYLVRLDGTPYAAKQVYRFTAMYFNGSWMWREKYSLSASGRRDGSNIFGSKTNDRWKPLWSAGLGWNISKESFFKSAVFDDLRLKVAYGHSGNVDLSKTAVPIASVIGNDINTNLPFSRIRQINNPSLRWEQVRQLNVGASFTMLNSRLSGSLEWYSKQGTDLYGPIEWDYTAFGSSSTITQNIADTRGRGIDLVLNSKNIKGAFSWGTGLLLSYNKTITQRYFGLTAGRVSNFLEGGNKITPVVGRDIYGVAAYKWGGLDAMGNPQGYLNGSLSTDYAAMRVESGLGTNLTYFGSGVPKYFGSLMNQFSYRKFALTINVTAKLDYYFFKQALSYGALVGGFASTNDYVRRWQQPGDELTTHVPSFLYPINNDRDYFYSASSVHVLNGGHIRLQYINLSYSPGFTNIKGIQDVQFYANAANLGILWRANGQRIDPDYPRGGQPSKAWSFGLRANF